MIIDPSPQENDKPTAEDLTLLATFAAPSADYESDSDVELTESDINVVKKKTSAQFRKLPSNNTEKQQPQPSWAKVLDHDLQHPPITIYEIPTVDFKIKLNPPLSNIRKRMLSKAGTRLADIPIRTIFHADRSLFEERTDSLLLVLKHSNVEGVILHVPLENLPRAFQSVAQRVASEWAAYHTKKETRFTTKPEVHLINTHAPANLKLSSDVEEWDDSYVEPALYPEQMTRRELRHALEKHNFTNFEGANTLSLRKKLRELEGLPPDPNDGIGLGRRYQKLSERDSDDDEEEDENDDSEDHSDLGDSEDTSHESLEDDSHPITGSKMELDQLELEGEENAFSGSKAKRKRKSPTPGPDTDPSDPYELGDDLIPSETHPQLSDDHEMNIDRFDAAIVPLADVSTDEESEDDLNHYAPNPRQLLQDMASQARPDSDGRKSSILDYYISPPKRLPRKAHSRAAALIGAVSSERYDENTDEAEEKLAKAPSRKKAKYAEPKSRGQVSVNEATSDKGHKTLKEGLKEETLGSTTFPPSIDGHPSITSHSASALLRASAELDETPEAKHGEVAGVQPVTSVIAAMYGASLASTNPYHALSSMAQLGTPYMMNGQDPISAASMAASGRALKGSPAAKSTVSQGSKPRQVPAAKEAEPVISASGRQMRSSGIAARSMLAKFTQEDADEDSDAEETTSKRRGKGNRRQVVSHLQSIQQQQDQEAFRLQQLFHQQQQMILQNQQGSSLPGVSDLLSLSNPHPSNINFHMNSPANALEMERQRANLQLLRAASAEASASSPMLVGAQIPGNHQMQHLYNDHMLEAMHRQSLALVPFLSPVSIPLDATAAQYANAMAQQHIAIMAALKNPEQPSQAAAPSASPFTLASALPMASPPLSNEVPLASNTLGSSSPLNNAPVPSSDKDVVSSLSALSSTSSDPIPASSSHSEDIEIPHPKRVTITKKLQDTTVAPSAE
jgi:hypothetical protein